MQMTEIVNHNRSTALERSVKIMVLGGGGGGGVNRFYVDTALALNSPVVYTRYVFVQSALRVSNSSVQQLRERKIQTNTELKQR